MDYLPLHLRQPYRFHEGGRFISDEDWSHMDRIIEDHELMIGVSGVVFLEVDGRLLELRESDILILFPGQRHRGYKLSAPGVSFYWFHFDPAEPPSGEPQSLIPRHARCSFPSRVHILARQLLHAASGGYAIAAAGDYFLTSLLIELGEQLHDSAGLQETDPRLAELLAWIRLHAHERPISLESAASRIGYNKDYLARMFKRKFGVSLLAYVHALKLDASKNLLAGSRLGVKEVAEKVGAGDDKQFSKWFKKKTGLTPTAYRLSFSGTTLNNR
ncbi:AraC family transcriptional regulator [Paenibacillus sp. P22]|nr:AraC family transcriptional regulator [Paenibacillus sp. P22]CDN42707.1 AraC family transcriptional regulator [Paenibacillus sp. P22]